MRPQRDHHVAEYARQVADFVTLRRHLGDILRLKRLVLLDVLGSRRQLANWPRDTP